MCVHVFRLEVLVKAFLEDPDPDVTLSMGPDMRKIQHCFSLLKVHSHNLHVLVFVFLLQFMNISSVRFAMQVH